MNDAEADATSGATRSTKRGQPSDVDLGARVRAARVAAGMNQTTLGMTAGVSYQQMQKYEAGKDRISAGTLFLFATALKVPVTSFFKDAPKPQPARQDKPARSGAGNDYSAKIVVLFQQIIDPGIRKQFVALAAVLADGQARGAPGIADEDDP